MFKRTRALTSLQWIAFGSGTCRAGVGAANDSSGSKSPARRSAASTPRRHCRSPIIQVEDLAKQGVTNAEQALQRIAANQSQRSARAGAVGATTGGKSEADLRGLSGPTGANANKTLVLLNGRRLANHPFDAAAADLNAIPLAAIDRIEVLRDGASAIYGTDAIGGVINFILRRDYQGLRGQRRDPAAASKGGGDTNRASITAGFGSLTENRFNVHGHRSTSASRRCSKQQTAPFAEHRHPVRRRRLRHQRHQLPGRRQRLRAVAAELRRRRARFLHPARHRRAATTSRATSTSSRRTSRRQRLVRGSFAITPDHIASVEFLHAQEQGDRQVAPAPTSHLIPHDQPVLPGGRHTPTGHQQSGRTRRPDTCPAASPTGVRCRPASAPAATTRPPSARCSSCRARWPAGTTARRSASAEDQESSRPCSAAAI